MSNSTAELLGHRYQIGREIGAGGMGIVYEAQDKLTGQTIALKRVTSMHQHARNFNPPLDTEVNLALAQEFKILASLRHPHIISVLDYGFATSNQPYFTMELIENGQDIVTATVDHNIPGKLQLIIQILQALSYLHRRGIVHRDLKPANVMVTNNHVKVLDFGLASPFNQTEVEETEEVAVGTIAYMAPELLQGEQASQASDLYALGVITYEILTGLRPFQSDSFHKLLMAILKEAPDLTSIERISSDKVKLSTQEMMVQPEPDTSDISSPSLALIIQRLLHKDANIRYQDAHEVIIDLCAATNIPLPPESVAIRESYLQAATFVGRQNELDKLLNALNKTADKQGSAWLIGGESGVGKSRLVDELRTQALVNRFTVLRGQAVSEQSVPYLLWRDILRSMCLKTDLNELEASVLKLIVPDIDRLIGRPVKLPPDLDVQASQGRLLMVIESIFRRQTQPMLVILEDLQWGNTGIRILKRLSQITSKIPLMIVGTYRDDERPQLPQDLPDMALLKLERLNAEEILALSTAMLGSDVGRNENIVGFIKRETEGNIFFIVEVMRVLAEEAGELSDIGSMTLPAQVFAEGMRAVIERRLGRIGEHERGLLQIAAVTGRQIDSKLLRIHLKSAEFQTINLDQWFNTCQDAAVIEVLDDVWRFTHDKLRESLIGELSVDKNQQLNEQVALALETSYPDDPQYYVKLSHHWHEAGNASKEQYYSILAGKQALAVGAYHNVMPLLKRSIELDAVHKLDDYDLAELEYLLGEAYVGAGNVAQSYEHNVRALEILNLPQPKSKLQFLTSFMKEGIEQYIHRLTMDRFNRWQKPTPQSKRLHLTAMICLRRMQIHYFRNEKIETVYYVMRGLNFAERAGVDSNSEVVQFLVTMSTAFGLLGWHKMARFYANRADAILETITNPKIISWGFEIRGLHEAGSANWEQGEAMLRHCNEVAKKSGDLRRWKEGAALLGYIFYHQGRWPEQIELLNELYTVATSSEQDIQVSSVALAGLTSNAFRRGLFDKALGHIAEVQGVLDEDYLRTTTVHVYGLKSQVELRVGHLDKAIEAADYVFQLIQENPPTAYYAIDGFIGSIDTYLRAWEQTQDDQYRAKIEILLKPFKKFAKTFAMARAIFTLQTSWYQWLRGDKEQALAGLQTALELAQTYHMPYEEGHAHFLLGRYLPTENAEHQKHLQAALQIFKKLGAQYDSEQVRAHLESVSF